MYTGIDYRQNASDCFRLAQEIADSAKKQMLVRMARDWFELGRRAASLTSANPLVLRRPDT